MDAQSTVMTMQGKRKITNYSGTVHGATILALAETVHGGAVLNKIGAFDHSMVTKKCELKFIRKAQGDLTRRFRLGQAQESYIKNQIRNVGKCKIELKTIVTD